LKTVVLGGYGNFGARICRALSSFPEIELVVAGRDAQRAARFAAELGNSVSSVPLDAKDKSVADKLRSLGAELVIHTAGPFQQQGYALPLAVAAAGAHYIDLADGRRFVCDFSPALDKAFRQQGRLAITGASTVPALSSAVVDDLSRGWQEIHSIDTCIAPAQTAPRGLATLAAVLDYCGAPIQVWRDGSWVTAYGWAAPRPVRFQRLRPRIGALCDIPDLELFPQRYPAVRTVMFRAALELGVTQRALAAVASLRRMGMIRQPARFAGLFHRTANSLDRFGTRLGGMVVCVTGTDATGKPARRAWHLAADHDHGPEIPCMAAILLARRLARHEIAATGAHACMGWLQLADFQPEFARWNMVTDVVEEGDYGA
jgi:saccharopine dehydrogenase-like NADP-dependent oxidoreductase